MPVHGGVDDFRQLLRFLRPVVHVHVLTNFLRPGHHQRLAHPAAAGPDFSVRRLQRSGTDHPGFSEFLLDDIGSPVAAGLPEIVAPEGHDAFHIGVIGAIAKVDGTVGLIRIHDLISHHDGGLFDQILRPGVFRGCRLEIRHLGFRHALLDRSPGFFDPRHPIHGAQMDPRQKSQDQDGDDGDDDTDPHPAILLLRSGVSFSRRSGRSPLRFHRSLRPLDFWLFDGLQRSACGGQCCLTGGGSGSFLLILFYFWLSRLLPFRRRPGCRLSVCLYRAGLPGCGHSDRRRFSPQFLLDLRSF